MPAQVAHSQRALSESSYEFVDRDVYCVLTRIRIRNPLRLLGMWRAYRKVRNEARRVRGLRQSAFLVEGPRTFVILSLWDHPSAFLDFGTHVHTHPPAVRQALHEAGGRRGLRVWSTEWTLRAVSHNLDWADFREWALGSHVEAQGHG